MAIQTAQVSIENIDDEDGLDSVMTALKNIYQNGHFSIPPSQECPFSA